MGTGNLEERISNTDFRYDSPPKLLKLFKNQISGNGKILRIV